MKKDRHRRKIICGAVCGLCNGLILVIALFAGLKQEWAMFGFILAAFLFLYITATTFFTINFIAKGLDRLEEMVKGLKSENLKDVPKAEQKQ